MVFNSSDRWIDEAITSGSILYHNSYPFFNESGSQIRLGVFYSSG